MRLDAELMAEPEKAAEEEKGVRERHERLTTSPVTPPKKRAAPNADGSEGATRPG
ncbi:hypothetical protein JNO44_41550 [Streptomyces noursei]|nr:hypothetical protein JNO44_41550 [Streptomyces noursei]